MRGEPNIISMSVDPRSGAIVEHHDYASTGGFWIARWPHGGPFDKGAGPSPAAAIAALNRRSRKEAA